MLDEIKNQKPYLKKMVIDRGKWSNTQNEVKSFETMNKNP